MRVAAALLAAACVRSLDPPTTRITRMAAGEGAQYSDNLGGYGMELSAKVPEQSYSGGNWPSDDSKDNSSDEKGYYANDKHAQQQQAKYPSLRAKTEFRCQMSVLNKCLNAEGKAGQLMQADVSRDQCQQLCAQTEACEFWLYSLVPVSAANPSLCTLYWMDFKEYMGQCQETGAEQGKDNCDSPGADDCKLMRYGECSMGGLGTPDERLNAADMKMCRKFCDNHKPKGEECAWFMFDAESKDCMLWHASGGSYTCSALYGAKKKTVESCGMTSPDMPDENSCVSQTPSKPNPAVLTPGSRGGSSSKSKSMGYQDHKVDDFKAVDYFDLGDWMKNEWKKAGIDIGTDIGNDIKTDFVHDGQDIKRDWNNGLGKDIKDDVTDKIVKAYNQGHKDTINFVNKALKKAKDAGRSITSGSEQASRFDWSSWEDKLKKSFDEIGAGIKSGGQEVINKIKKGGQLAVDKIQTGGQEAIDKIKTGGQQTVDKIQTGGQQVVDKFKSDSYFEVSEAENEGQEAMDKIESDGQEAEDKIKSGGQQTMDKIKSDSQGTVDKMKTVGQTTADKIKSDGQEAEDKIKSGGQEAMDKIKGSSQETADKIKTTGQTTVDKIKTDSQQTADKLDSDGQQAMDKIKSNGQEAVDKVKTAGQTAADKTKSGGQKAVDQLKTDEQKTAGQVTTDEQKVADQATTDEQKAADKLKKTSQDVTSEAKKDEAKAEKTTQKILDDLKGLGHSRRRLGSGDEATCPDEAVPGIDTTDMDSACTDFVYTDCHMKPKRMTYAPNAQMCAKLCASAHEECDFYTFQDLKMAGFKCKMYTGKVSDYMDSCQIAGGPKFFDKDVLAKCMSPKDKHCFQAKMDCVVTGPILNIMEIEDRDTCRKQCNTQSECQFWTFTEKQTGGRTCRTFGYRKNKPAVPATCNGVIGNQPDENCKQIADRYVEVEESYLPVWSYAVAAGGIGSMALAAMALKAAAFQKTEVLSLV